MEKKMQFFLIKFSGFFYTLIENFPIHCFKREIQNSKDNNLVSI